MAEVLCAEHAGASARIVSAFGTLARNGRPAALGDFIQPGDVLTVGADSRAAIAFCATDTVLRLDADSELRFGKPRGATALLELLRGALYFFSRQRQNLDVHTPYINAGVKGTEFVLRVVPGQRTATLSVLEGRVTLRPARGTTATFEKSEPSATVSSGQSVQARAEGATARIVVRGVPLQRARVVQWVVYYQPVLSGLSAPGVPAAVREAGRLLAAGQLERARATLERVVSNGSATGEAFGLLAVIAVAQNRNDEALRYGREAVHRSPGSAAARIALSYAQQANFRLPAARDSLLQAVKDRPDDALAWARLAEIRLSLGDRPGALEAAQRAERLAPNLSRTRTVLGFAQLAALDARAAAREFDAAIRLDSQDPLPRLGLGLARIRDGELHAGGRELEIAAVLDPDNSLVRSYLGKAYFEEKRAQTAAEQFDIAKQLDAADPTPWLYSAILEQTENRPVEALHDLQQSIARNDNRAVYRSRLLLDEDRAARSAALGQVYRDLGFEQRALAEGWTALESDPANYSAHRFLADTYLSLPRHEPARVSELLRSQLLQPVNITPVQPQMGEASLFILEGAGPTSTTFNEFNPLFDRNRLAVQAAGVLGGLRTRGDEAVVSGVRNAYSFSLGQFHYKSDGVRQNDDQNRNIYDLFGQAMLSADSSAQAELRYTDTDHGDLALRFDPNNFDPNLREHQRVRSARIGIHHNFAPGSDVIGSFIYRSVDDGLQSLPGFSINTVQRAFLGEAQYILRRDNFNITLGASRFSTDETDIITTVLPVPFPPFSITQTATSTPNLSHSTAYVYSNVDLPASLTATLGASADFLHEEGDNHRQFNPKFGLTWRPAGGTTLRAAMFRTLQRSTVLSGNTTPTIEPTEVAGFNQVYFGGIGDSAWNYGAGVDQKFSGSLYAGAELTQRDLDVPVTLIPPPPAAPIPVNVTANWKEQLGRAYVYWTPVRSLALSAEYLYERFQREALPGLAGPEGIADLRTHRIPLSIRYFTASGLLASLTGTYIDQSGNIQDHTSGAFVPGADQFWNFDASIGYRLPRRHGFLRFEVKNLFDKHFRFQDTDPESPALLPERLVLIKFVLNF